MNTYDKETVRSQLIAHVESVVSRFTKCRCCGRELRTGVCPTCGPRTRSDAVSVSLDTGLWHCHAHGCKGDMFDLVAGFSGFDAKVDFPRALALAADIVGVQPGDTIEARVEREQARRQRLAEQDARRAADAGRQRDEARRRAGVEWRFVRRWRRHPDGERYLQARGVDPHTLLERDLVRFSGIGDVVVAQHDFDGEIVNVVRRLRAPKQDEPKVRGVAKCTTSGSLVGRIQEIGAGATVIVEGVMDALTAAALWPERVVLGANGAGRYAELVRVASARVLAKRGRLFLISDDDTAGKRALAAAVKAATDAGLRLARDLVLVDLRGHHDLNDAHRAGWKQR